MRKGQRHLNRAPGREEARNDCLTKPGDCWRWRETFYGPAGFPVLLRKTALLLFISALGLASARGQSSTSTASQAQTHLARGQAALAAGDAATATKEFREALALDPRNAASYANLGVIAFFERDYSQAVKYLSRAIEIEPSSTKIQALLGICDAKLGNPSAQGLLEKAFPKLKDQRLQTATGMALANLYYQEGNLGQAAEVAGMLTNENPDSIDVLFAAQRIYSELAYKTTNKLAVLAPGSAQLQEVIAERLVNAGDLPDAIKHYRKALTLDPGLRGVHFELGEAILQSAPDNAQNQVEAEHEFETAKRGDGDTPAIECELGDIALRQSRLAEAYAYYQRAFKMDPGDSEADLGVAKTLMTMGKTDDALPYLREAIQSDPLNDDAHYRLAEVYRKLNRTNESDNEFHLFQDIKQTKDRVRQLYREMNPRRDSPGIENAKPHKPS